MRQGADDPPMDAARAFRELIRVPEPDIDLARGALCIARIEYPRLLPDRTLAALDELAARSGAAGLDDGLRILHRLREFLFAEEGFRGNADDYYDPRNSCLNDVLERRLGIPITLALVVMEVGARVGLRIKGIGLPGHFVVGAQLEADSVLLDPFNGGAVLTPDGAHRVVSRAVGRPVKLTEENFAPCSRRQILGRMLGNLKAVYVSRREWTKALATIECLLTVEADVPAHRRDRGSVLVKLGQFHRGVADWERYLTENLDAPDTEAVRQQLRRVREGLAALN
jgi:regulator of sirC expression with transglutaminase-like and TPR domain